MNIKSLFKQFLIGYVSNGATVDRPSMRELNRLTDEFLDDITADFYFNEITLIDYLETMTEKLSDENRHFFKLGYKRSYYIDELEGYIKHLINVIDSNFHFRGFKYIDSDDSSDDEKYDSEGFLIDE